MILLHIFNFSSITPYHYTYLNILSGEKKVDIQNLRMTIGQRV